MRLCEKTFLLLRAKHVILNFKYRLTTSNSNIIYLFQCYFMLCPLKNIQINKNEIGAYQPFAFTLHTKVPTLFCNKLVFAFVDKPPTANANINFVCSHIY